MSSAKSRPFFLNLNELTNSSAPSDTITKAEGNVVNIF